MTDQAAPGRPALDERLRGVGSSATVVDDLIDRIMANPLVDEPHHRVPPAGCKDLLTETLRRAAGRPQRATGRAMEPSHRHLRMTAGAWQDLIAGLRRTFHDYRVAEAEPAEVEALVDSTRSAIVADQPPPELLLSSTAVGQGLPA